MRNCHIDLNNYNRVTIQKFGNKVPNIYLVSHVKNNKTVRKKLVATRSRMIGNALKVKSNRHQAVFLCVYMCVCVHSFEGTTARALHHPITMTP